MSTSKHIDRICIAALILALLCTLLFMNGEKLGVVSEVQAAGYETRLFSTDKVHTIDIEMDDWDDFIENCESEEYSACTLVIDGEKQGNVGLRAKGNTSLSNVSSMNSQRYSFKIEFDQYEDGKSYYGLDKLCLNNLIQDNTMMKDYLAYQMMADFGVDAPLCSYAYITVNGEDWGLYLAVEGIEDSFLERNYGSDYGDLYKPDSMSFGGGRGNGKGFNMDDFDFDTDSDEDSDSDSSGAVSSDSESSDSGHTHGGYGNRDGGAASGNSAGGGFDPGQGQMPSQGENSGDNAMGEMPTQGGASGDDASAMPQAPSQDGTSGDSIQASGAMAVSGNMPEMPDGMTMSGNMPEMPDGMTMSGNMPEMPDGMTMSGNFSFGDSISGNNAFQPGNQGGGMGGGMGSDDVKLKYIDDNADSYSNIFDNAKTEVTEEDEDRLIASLKNLSEYTDLEDTLDIDEVLRYFVVHNYLVNGDSYTGSMIHNYYLYEEDGQLSMIPWDYNLAFGSFQGNNASDSVNSDIDDPVSSGDLDDRPMVGWIFSDESYTNAYHELFSEFVEKWYTSGKAEQLIDETEALISPYVESDPTKFCTTEEFETGVSALKEFVNLRFEAVNNQLNGNDDPVDTGDLNLSDMGTMNTGGGGMGRK